MAQERLWTRMGRWFRREPVGLPPVGRDGFLEGLPAANEAGERGVVNGPKRSKVQLREQALEKLQDGHLKVIALMESLQTHMEAQDRCGQAMAGSLESMAENLGRLSEVADRQAETLGGIATQLQTGNDRARRWEDSFAKFPALAEAQRATLTTLAEQLSAGRQADERIGESLEAVRDALSAVDRSTATSTEVLRTVRESSDRNQELVGELILKQRKWLARLVVVTLVAALAAVTLAVVALLR